MPIPFISVSALCLCIHDCHHIVRQKISLSEKTRSLSWILPFLFLFMPDHCTLAVSIAPPGVCYRIGYGPLDNSIDTVLSLLRSNTLVMSKGTPKTQRCYIKRRGATKIAEVLQIAEVLLQSQKCHGGSRCALVAEMRW